MYPNPAKSYIIIENKFISPKEYEIWSVQGKLLLNGVINSKNHRIDLSGLLAGTYLLIIGNQNIKLLVAR